MAVAANRLVGEAPLASPELALVDAELAAELRLTLGPVEDRWLRPPARVEDASAESGQDAPVQLESADDAGYAESRLAEQLHDDEYIVSTPEQTPAEELRPTSHDPVLPATEPEEAAFEDSPQRPQASSDEAPAESEDDAPAQWDVADILRETEPRAEQLQDDEYIVSTTEQTPAEELRPSSHDPVLPAPAPEDAAFEDSPQRPQASSDEAPAESEDDAPAQWDVADVLREAEPRAEQLLIDEYIVAVPEETPVQEQRSSHYPVLPAPEPEREAIEETDAALRRIRERLHESNESPARKSRLRRAFTVASGVITMCALGVFAVDAELQVGQLPSWLPF